MEVVVRTPHGDADVAIVAAPPDTTLADLVRAVTGQAPPPTAVVDGRTVATADRLAEVALVLGSLIDTRPVDPTSFDSPPPSVDLIQLSGFGAGTIIELPAGRHRIGTSRRLHASELDQAAVETTAFEILVDADGTARARPGTDIGGALGVYTPTIDGQLFDRTVDWTHERLSVGGRLFEVTPSSTSLPPPSPPADADGRIPFIRAAGTQRTSRRPAVDAVRAATRRTDDLWQRRRTDGGAFDLVFGVHADSTSIASVDLQRHRGVALVGSERFTSALGRTLLIEAATLHGPADLSIAVATTPARRSAWNWTKWLPHARRGDEPALFDDDAALAAWATSLDATESAPTPNNSLVTHTDDAAGGSPATIGSPLTLLLLDDISLWSRRDSPVRRLLADPPPSLRVMALCIGLHEAPGMCTSLIEEVAPADRLAHLSSTAMSDAAGRPALFGSLATQHTRLADAPHVTGDIRPALAQISTAHDVARRLAPLDDLDAPSQARPAARPDAPLVSDLVDQRIDSEHSDDPLDADQSGGLPVVVGPRHRTAHGEAPHDADSHPPPVAVDLAADGTTVLLAERTDTHDATLAAIVLGAASRHDPEHLAIVVVSDEVSAWHEALPHTAGWLAPDDVDDASELVHRIAQLLSDRSDLQVLVVLDRAVGTSDSRRIEVVEAMLELGDSLTNVHSVLTGAGVSLPASSLARFGAVVTVDADGLGRLEHPGDPNAPTRSFVAATLIGDAPPDADTLVIRPTSIGRAMTPLERRLRRGSDTGPADADERAALAVAERIAERYEPAVGDAESLPPPTLAPAILPPPLPAEIAMDTLLSRYGGDAIPLGVIDRPARSDDDAYWWQPVSGGSLLAAGSPRSGVTAVLDLVLQGIAARCAADDVHVFAIEALPQRRRAISLLPHAADVVTPDEPETVQQLVAGLHRILRERIEQRDHADRVAVVVLLGDVSRLRRSLAPEVVDAVFDQIADIATGGATVAMSVIAVASRVDDLGGIARITGDRLVGALSDADDRARLGAPATSDDSIVGRCWSTTAGREVQLATPASPLDDAITALDPATATLRPPTPIVGAEVT